MVQAIYLYKSMAVRLPTYPAMYLLNCLAISVSQPGHVSTCLSVYLLVCFAWRACLWALQRPVVQHTLLLFMHYYKRPPDSNLRCTLG